MNWNVLIWGLPVCVLLGGLYEVGYDNGKAAAEFSINKAALEAQARENLAQDPQTLDQQCSAWLFDTNAKDAKRRICSK